jgi:hypothetical protein
VTIFIFSGLTRQEPNRQVNCQGDTENTESNSKPNRFDRITTKLPNTLFIPFSNKIITAFRYFRVTFTITPAEIAVLGTVTTRIIEAP